MRLSNLFTRTAKESAQSDVSRNARLLTRAGYVHQLMAGVYSFLPLGLRVLNRIESIIREEMDSIGGQEILMPALQPREIWDRTGRWDKVDVLFKLKGAGDREVLFVPIATSRGPFIRFRRNSEMNREQSPGFYAGASSA